MATYSFERETRTTQSESFVIEREGEEVGRVDLHYAQSTAYATLCVTADFEPRRRVNQDTGKRGDRAANGQHLAEPKLHDQPAVQPGADDQSAGAKTK